MKIHRSKRLFLLLAIEIIGISIFFIAVKPEREKLQKHIADVITSLQPMLGAGAPGICPGTKGVQKFNCYQAFYENLTREKGAAVAFQDLKQRYVVDPYAHSQCHQLTHAIGHGALQDSASLADTFAHGDSFCWSGYYHGVMEEVVEKIGIEALPEQLNTICAPMKKGSTQDFYYYNCVHGLGHGVMAIKNNELFDALALCGKLSDRWDQEACSGGVFMENVMLDTREEGTKYLHPDDPVYPCNDVEEKYKPQCYVMQTSYMMSVLQRDFSKVFALCATVSERYQDICYEGVGRDASGQTLSSIDETVKLCNLGTTRMQREHCMIGAVKDFVSYYHSDTEANKLCYAVQHDLLDSCLTTVKAYYKLF